jgi:valyl-tRNA synthetase
LVKGVRNTRTEYNVDPGKRITALASAGANKTALQHNDFIFQRLCNIESITMLADDDAEPANSASVVAGNITLYLPLDGMLDIEAECKRLTTKQEDLNGQLARTEKMLGNENFISKARPDVVQRERDRLAELQAELSQIEERLASLCN